MGWVARGTLWLGESEQARKEGGAERDREERERELVSARRATHRLNKCAAADWDEDHWGEEAHVGVPYEGGTPPSVRGELAVRRDVD